MLCILCCNLPKQNLLLQVWQRRIVDVEPHRHRLPLILQLDVIVHHHRRDEDLDLHRRKEPARTGMPPVPPIHILLIRAHHLELLGLYRAQLRRLPRASVVRPVPVEARRLAVEARVRIDRLGGRHDERARRQVDAVAQSDAGLDGALGHGHDDGVEALRLADERVEQLAVVEGLLGPAAAGGAELAAELRAQRLDVVRVEGEVEDAGGALAGGRGGGRAGNLRLRAGGCGAVDGGHAQAHLVVREVGVALLSECVRPVEHPLQHVVRLLLLAPSALHALAPPRDLWLEPLDNGVVVLSQAGDSGNPAHLDGEWHQQRVPLLDLVRH